MSIFDIQEPVQPQHLSTIALEIAIDSYPLVAWPWLVFGRKMENAESYNLEIQKFNPLAALQPVASHRFNQGISVIGDDRVFYILVPQIQTDRLVYDYTSALVDLYALDPDSAQNEPQKIKTLVLPHHSTRVLQQKIKTLVDVLQNSGHHIAVWDGRDSNGTLCAAGIYFIRATIGQRHFNKKMLYIP